MKILKNHIKRWGFKQRLYEIQQRLKNIKEDLQLTPETEEKIDEIQQIVDYWMSHMAGEVEKVNPKKKKKEVNLW